jgi:Putative Ig domain
MSCHPERSRSSQRESRRSRGTLGSSTLILATILLSAPVFAQRSPLSITTESLAEARPHEPYTAKLQATGGTPPLRWSISAGDLPNGLELNAETGAITGTAAEPGDFELTITVTDSSVPPQTAVKHLKLKSVGALSVAWKVFPQIAGEQISGSLTVSNGTKDLFDVTVIVVAVNEVGKAFALGYQRFDLQAEKEDFEITFGSTLPRGRYVVHADAIAEVPAKKSIFRDRLQTPQALVITAPSL